VPGRQAEFVRVLGPGVGATAFRDHRAEPGIGQHVAPGRRCRLPGRKADHVLAAVGAEAAVVVAQLQALAQRDVLRRFSKHDRFVAARLGLQRARQRRVQRTPPDLLGQRTLVVAEHHARHRLHQHAVLAGDLVRRRT
jgi:hypothetical protein